MQSWLLKAVESFRVIILGERAPGCDQRLHAVRLSDLQGRANLACRTEQGFVQETHAELDAVIPLPEIGIELPLAEIYDGVELTPEPEDEE